jgi:signal transduction histidine kinase
MGETEVALVDLEPGRNQLQIDFVALGFAPGERLRYQYQLEGSGAGWSALTEQRTVNLASLASGSYRFVVRAVNSDGVLSVQPATITFTILRPFWLRWWFLSLSALALVAVVYAGYSYRVAHLLEVANMRTRIATDLHDDIGTNLTKIAILSEVARQQLGDAGGEGLLGSIARVSRESVASMGDIVWAISPQRDSLLDLVRRMRRHAEDLFSSRDIGMEFDAPGVGEHLKLGAEMRRDLFLIFKEATGNAARHSHCSRVNVSLCHDGAWLVLQVVDDGVGFDPTAESEGQGLMSMRRRVHGLDGTFEIEPGDNGGTTLRVRVPCVRQRNLHFRRGRPHVNT